MLQDQIGEMKVKCNTPELVKDLPPQFLAFMKHLKSLNYSDRPDYNHLYSILTDLYHSSGYDEHTPFDWEVGAPLRSPQYTATPHLSTQDVEFSRAQSNLPHNTTNPPNPLALSRATLEDDIGTMSPLPSQHSLQHLQNHNYSPKLDDHQKISRRDSESVIAASTSSEEKQTGSWEKKSSPRPTNASSNNPPNANTKPEDVHVKVTHSNSTNKIKIPPDKGGDSDGVGGVEGGSKPNLRDKEHTSCRCTIM